MKKNQINQISILISQIQHQNNESATVGQQWMLKHLTDTKFEKIITKISVVAYHILDALNPDAELTGSQLAEQLMVTRSGITRAARTLQKFSLITAVRHPDNKKNIYYRLTADGQILAQLHGEMHAELYAEVQNQISNDFSEEELDSIIRFLTYIQKSII